MNLTERKKAQLLQNWKEDGAPDDICQRQLNRLERDDFGMNDALAARVGAIRLLLTNEQYWALFDAAQDAVTWEKLPEKWKDLVTEAEAEAARQMQAAGL